MTTNDPKALLRRLLREDTEAEWLEFKHNNADPERIGRTISACSNGAILKGRPSAYVVWGIEDKTKARLGTTVRLKALKKGGENLENWLSHRIEPRLQMEMLDFEDEGQRYSIIVVEQTYERPVKFNGTAYFRIGENVKNLADHPNHERSLWEATSRYKFEQGVALTNQTEDDVLAKLDTDAYYKLVGVPVPKNPAEVVRRLIRLECVRENMEDAYDITNLGALLFAREISVFPSIAAKSLRIVKYAGRDKASSEDERVGQMGYALGFSGALAYIEERLPKKEEIINGVRKRILSYSAISIREILANALIHQDFTLRGTGPMVEIYQDRIEITNPGSSLIGVDRIIDERRSRNERLASTMRDLGICEERGSGIDKAIIDIEERSLPAPEFYASDDSMRVVLFGPKTFGRLSKDEKIWSCFCHCVVRWSRHDFMSNASLRKRFSLSDDEYQAVSGVIAAARKAGRIIEADPDQGNRNARYIPYWCRPRS